VVDNGSTDGSDKELLELLMEQSFVLNRNTSCTIVKFVHLQRNLGFSNGINIALKFISKESKYIMIVNNDVVIYSEYIIDLINFLELLDEVGCIQGKILQWDEATIDSAGCLITEFGDWLKLGYTMPKQYFNVPYLITYSHAVLTICRRDVFTGFLPYFFVFGDDFEFGTRLYAQGFAVLYYPLVVGKHFGSATSKFNRDIAEITTFFKEVGGVAILWIMPIQKLSIIGIILKIFRILMNFINSILQRNKVKARAIIEGIILGLRISAHRSTLYKRFKGISIEPPILKVRMKDIPLLLFPKQRKFLYLTHIKYYIRKHALI
jgi:GT2 family glycosyltransferase